MDPIQKHHDRIKSEFRNQSPNWNQTVSPELEDIVQGLNLRSDYQVLDLAAGSGLFSRALSPWVKSVTALDISPDMIAQGQKINEQLGINNVQFVEGSAENLPFADDHFDYLVTRFSIHHFLEPEGILSEMVRVYNGIGNLVIIDIAAPEDQAQAREYNRIETIRDATHTWAYSPSGLLQLVNQSNLNVQHLNQLQVEMDLIEWYDKVNLDLAKRAEIDKLINEDISGEYTSGMEPFVSKGRVKFVHRWAVVTAGLASA